MSQTVYGACTGFPLINLNSNWINYLIVSTILQCYVVLFHLKEWVKREAWMNSYVLAAYRGGESLHSWTILIKSPVKGSNFLNKTCVTCKVHCLFKLEFKNYFQACSFSECFYLIKQLVFQDHLGRPCKANYNLIETKPTTQHIV